MSTSTIEGKPFTPPPPSAEHLATKKVADRLVELCSQGKHLDAIHELYADNARHVEAMSGPGCPGVTEGKQALIKSAEHWNKITTVHDASIGKPIINGDQFVLPMSMDCTASEGPCANVRMQMSETCLYTVKNGKITEGKFFYGC